MRSARAIALFIPFLVTGAALVLFATAAYGAGLTPDSVGYVAAARNLSSGDGYVNHLGSLYVIKPPAFPAILALIKLVSGADPLESGRVLNAAIAGCTVGLAALILARHARWWLAVTGAGALLISVPLFDVATMVWSEPLFNLLVLSFLALILSERRRGSAQIVWLGVIAATACLTRYLGFSLVVTGLLLIFLWRDPPRLKVTNLARFGTISLAPIGLWLAHNLIAADTLFGPRAPSQSAFRHNLDLTYTTIFTWLLPDLLQPYRGLILVALLVVCALAGLAAYAGGHAPLRWRGDLPPAAQLSLFVLIYALLLTISATTTAYDPIDTRLLSPIAAPLWIVGALALESALSALGRWPPRWRFVAAALLIGVLAFWLALQARDAALSVQTAREQGMGDFNNRAWRNSAVIAYVEQNLRGEPLYSNRPEALYIRTGVRAETLPRRTFYASHKPADDLADLEGRWPAYPAAYLVFFADGRSYLFSPGELSTIAEVDLVAELADGDIYALRPAAR